MSRLIPGGGEPCDSQKDKQVRKVGRRKQSLLQRLLGMQEGCVGTWAHTCMQRYGAGRDSSLPAAVSLHCPLAWQEMATSPSYDQMPLPSADGLPQACYPSYLLDLRAAWVRVGWASTLSLLSFVTNLNWGETLLYRGTVCSMRTQPWPSLRLHHTRSLQQAQLERSQEKGDRRGPGCQGILEFTGRTCPGQMRRQENMTGDGRLQATSAYITNSQATHAFKEKNH